MDERDDNSAGFVREADAPAPGHARGLLDFMVHSKKWWLTPIILVLLLVAALLVLSGSSAGPLIYTLF